MNDPTGKFSRSDSTCLPWLALSLSLLASTVAWAQPDGMPSAAEMAEMQKELAEAMRDMQAGMNELDPETRQQVEKMLKGQRPRALTAEAISAPKKTMRVPDKPLAPKELKAYVQQLQTKIAKALSAEALDRAQRVEEEGRRQAGYLDNLRAAANGLAAWGAWPEATFLTGKAAMESGSAQDLNNLAAMLTMQHAEAAALPILYTLNARYPDNSTLLNNIGQALYGLDDQAGATKFLAAAVKRAPNHPQANTTQASLQMARGDKAAAQASLNRALQSGYSETRESLLRQSGGKLDKSGMRWNRRMPQDPLGLEKFVVPAFPQKATELPAAIKDWRNFRERLGEEIAELSAREQAASGQLDEKLVMKNAAYQVVSLPFVKKAATMMKQEAEHYQRAQSRQIASLVEAIQADALASQALERRIEAIDAAGEDRYSRVSGGYQREYTCGEVMTLLDAYLNQSNQRFEELQRTQLETARKHINETAYMAQFVTPTPELFEAAKLSARKGYLGELQGMQVALPEGIAYTREVCFQDKKTGTLTALQKFDDIHCEYVTSLDLPGMGRIDYRCNQTVAKMNPIFAPFEASWTTEITDQNTLRVVRASAEVSIEAVSIGGHSEFDEQGWKSGGVKVGVSGDLGPTVKGGPLQVGLEAGGSMTMEFDRNGINDIAFNAGVESKASSTIGKTDAAGSKATVKAGANSTWSWNAGYSDEVGAGFKSSVF